LQCVGVTLRDHLADALAVADGSSEVSVKDALPIIEVLLAEREIEPVSMARSLEIGDGETFTEHLLNWVSGDEVDQEEDERDDEPDHWQGV